MNTEENIAQMQSLIEEGTAARTRWLTALVAADEARRQAEVLFVESEVAMERAKQAIAYFGGE